MHNIPNHAIRCILRKVSMVFVLTFSLHLSLKDYIHKTAADLNLYIYDELVKKDYNQSVKIIAFIFKKVVKYILSDSAVIKYYTVTCYFFVKYA